jgi:hypothetical protein
MDRIGFKHKSYDCFKPYCNSRVLIYETATVFFLSSTSRIDSMAMGREGARAAHGEGGARPPPRGPATPCRARAPAGGGRAWGGLTWARAADKAKAMAGRLATPSDRGGGRGRPQRLCAHGLGAGRRAAGQGCGGSRCYPKP